MNGTLRQGLSRAEFLRIIMRSERPEESTLDPVCTEHMLNVWPEYDPDATVLEIDGVAVGAGGLRMIGTNLAVLWLVSSVDAAPYKFMFMRRAYRLVQRARSNGIHIMATAVLNAPKAAHVLEHLGLTRVGEDRHHAIYQIR